ncbi:unnamed protein product [Eretmochelys imbricata]
MSFDLTQNEDCLLLLADTQSETPLYQDATAQITSSFMTQVPESFSFQSNREH